MAAAAGDSEPGRAEGSAAGDGEPAAWRLAWRRWRHSRPFLGGLLVVLAGLEILISEEAPLPLVIHIGLQGLAGYLVPAVMVLCGVLLLFHPVQQTFYSILAVLLALGSWITSNLGGFFVGMLLGLAGGALAFAWQPPGERGPGHSRRRRAPGQPSAGLDLIRGRRTGGAGPPGQAGDAGPGSGHPARALGATAVLAVPLAPIAPLAVSVLLAHVPRGQVPAAPSRSASGTPAPAPPGTAPSPGASGPVPQPGPAGGGGGVPQPTGPGVPQPTGPGVPSPTGPAGPSPTGPGGPSPTPHPSADPTPRPGGTHSPAPPGRHHRHRRRPAAAAAPRVPVPAGQTRLTAGLAMFSGLAFDGVARVRTPDGVVPMVKFRMRALTLSGVRLLVSAGTGESSLTRNASLGLTGNIVLYAARISGDVHGVRVTFTPRQVPRGMRPDLVLTHLVADQPFATADSLQASGLRVAGR